jgi:hypothetical protein
MELQHKNKGKRKTKSGNCDPNNTNPRGVELPQLFFVFAQNQKHAKAKAAAATIFFCCCFFPRSTIWRWGVIGTKTAAASSTQHN